MGIIQLHKTYTSDRLNRACGIALSTAAPESYNFIRNILENNQDVINDEKEDLNNTASHIPNHSNTRGSSHYK